MRSIGQPILTSMLSHDTIGTEGDPDFDKAMGAWIRMKRRADKIRIEAKIPKKAEEMRLELLSLKRTIKDLESLSEVGVPARPHAIHE